MNRPSSLFIPAALALSLSFCCAVANLPAQAPTAPAAPASNPAARNAPLPPEQLFTPVNQIVVTRMPAVIKRAFARMAQDQSQAIPFNESRGFSISKQPVRQAGTLRSSKQYGMSMAYEGAKPRILIIDDKGLIERIPGGRERQVNVADHPELSALTDLYLNLLRGNGARLFDYAEVYFAGGSRAWQLGLVPRDAAVAKRAGKIVIYGAGRNIRRIDNLLSSGDTRTMELGEVERNPAFTPEQVQAFFRHDG